MLLGCLSVSAAAAVATTVALGGTSAETSRAPGGKIAFVRFSVPVGRPRIYVVRPGGAPRALHLPGDATQGPAWSRNGRKLAFIAGANKLPSPDISGHSVLYVSTVGRSGPRAVTNGRFRDGQAAWAPGGEQLAFVRSRPGNLSSIWVVGADGRSRRRLTRGHLDLEPSWAPDGRTIAFLRVSRKTFQSGIWLMRSDGSHAHRILRRIRNLAEPVWSPGGGRLLVQNGRTLYSVRPDGSGRRTIVTLGTDARGAREDPQAAWSPDGRWVVFCQFRHTATTASDIWMVRANGTGLRRVTRSVGLDTDPSWAP